MKLISWISLITIGLCLGSWILSHNPPQIPPKILKQQPQRLRQITIDLSQYKFMQTLVGYHYTNKPPWPKGNCLTFIPNSHSNQLTAGWQLVNMHAENFHEFQKRHKLKTLELGLLNSNQCLVIDNRIPREWLLLSSCSCCSRLENRLLLKSQFSDHFQKEPRGLNMSGSSWQLINNKDPDGLIHRVLPGDTLSFGTTNLLCLSETSKTQAHRVWEITGTPENYFLSVYELQSSNDYTGASFKIRRYRDQMILTPQSKLSRNASGIIGEVYSTAAEAGYQLKEK